MAVKDPMTFYLLKTGVGYLGDVKLFDATQDDISLVQTITDEDPSTTEAASVKAIVDYVATKLSESGVLNARFFRDVKSHTLTADDLANENIVTPDDAAEGDIGLLFTADTNEDDDDNEVWYFISLKNYLTAVHTFVSGKTIAFTVGDDNAVTAEVKIDEAETTLRAGDNGLVIEKVDTIDSDNPTGKLVTESALVAYLQAALHQLVSYTVDDDIDTE